MNRTTMGRIQLALLTALALGTAAFTYAQEPEEPKPPKQEEPRPHGDEDKPRPERQQEEPKAPKENQKDQAKPAQAEKGQPAQESHARPAGKSAHIPDAKFKSNFGRQHSFAVRQVVQTTTVVTGQTQFVYGGYTFVFLDPWPTVWLLTDDCYVDYVDGEYFLFDILHPGIRVALFVEG